MFWLQQPPSSPSKNSERLSPSTKYVIPRLPDGYCCNGKHHDSPLDWVSYESNYFTKTYKKGKTHLPTHCLRCSARLMSAREAKQLGKTSKEKVYAVTGSQSVWACQEVFTPSAPGNKCNRVFCNTCYAIASNKVQCVPLWEHLLPVPCHRSAVHFFVRLFTCSLAAIFLGCLPDKLNLIHSHPIYQLLITFERIYASCSGKISSVISKATKGW